MPAGARGLPALVARRLRDLSQAAPIDWTGSIAMLESRALRWGGSSAGRAPRSQCGGRGFDPLPLHQSPLSWLIMDVQPRPRSSSKSLKSSIFTLAAGHLKSPGRRLTRGLSGVSVGGFAGPGTPIMSLTHSAVLRRPAAGPAIAKEWLAHAVGFAPALTWQEHPPTPGCGMLYVRQRSHLALLCGSSTSSSGVPHDEGVIGRVLPLLEQRHAALLSHDNTNHEL